MQHNDNKQRSYEYKRFNRDGSVTTHTAVVRTKKPKKEIKRVENNRRM